jgi:hypothetical protein
MTDYKRQPSGHDCPPAPTDPADQPQPPGAGDTCKDLPTTTPPTLQPPEHCPPSDCCCPKGPTSTPNCLEDLIAKQAASIAAAEKAGKFKDDLAKLLDSAKKASQEYTKDKHDALVDKWVEADGQIADLIRKLVCVVPCWRCVIECHVCPPINDIKMAEKWLYGDGTLYADVHNLYDLQYWLTRDRDAKERLFNRIKAVLDVWAAPAKTLEAALQANKGLIVAAGTLLNSDPGKAVYDVFLKLVPLHLAIAPPKGPDWQTKIGKEYTQFCDCDTGTPDDCCGPDVGVWSVRQRITGPQPYLIDPNDYFKLICCLVQKRYGPAREALGKADADLAAVQSQIARYKAQIDAVKDFEKNTRPTVPSAIDCCDYERHDSDGKPSQAR